jgi:hypothetical protein
MVANHSIQLSYSKKRVAGIIEQTTKVERKWMTITWSLSLVTKLSARGTCRVGLTYSRKIRAGRQLGLIKRIGSDDIAPEDYFGYDIAISSDHIVVGALVLS